MEERLRNLILEIKGELSARAREEKTYSKAIQKMKKESEKYFGTNIPEKNLLWSIYTDLINDLKHEALKGEIK
ncbi:MULTISPECIES: hypothetical protein [Liquorilactobacillus]|uniref:hypothetical protein n=1 Tax=Liquorilactobacillus TaxID=2767888 RepID=UPI0039ED9860